MGQDTDHSGMVDDCLPGVEIGKVLTNNFFFFFWCSLALKGNREVGKCLEEELEFLTLTFKTEEPF